MVQSTPENGLILRSEHSERLEGLNLFAYRAPFETAPSVPPQGEVFLGGDRA